MKSLTPISILAVVMLAACSGESLVPDPDLLKVKNYPQVTDAQLAVGTMSYSPGCVIFNRKDGIRFIPIFPLEASLKSLQNQVGDLSSPREVTVSGMTVLEPSPRFIAEELKRRGCDGRPFYLSFVKRGHDAPTAIKK
ncbi:hypothetical protein [Sphingobium sp.]|uniref:hypothetical protein n=1 Tax=Sphingobium sp. TaxID=1912891 RepID=UPI00257AB53B|nr:hypothetical protein [Sphingobium sp.]